MKNKFQERDEIEFTQKILNKLCEENNFPKSKVASVLIRENIRFLQSIAVPSLEIECHHKTGIPHVLQCKEAKPIIRQVLQEHLLPEYEERYYQKIRYLDYKIIYQQGQYQLFAITIFENPIFSQVDADVRRSELVQAGLLAKSFRDLTGRGPKKIRAICMSSDLTVYLINGFLSKGNRLFASKGRENAEQIETIVEHHLHEALKLTYTNSNQAINNMVNMIDLENDSIVTLVFSDVIR